MKWWLFILIVGCSEAHAVAPKKPDQPAVSRLPLAERLAREAASRPERAVRAEPLIEALRERGVTIVRHRQVLASPVDASYCEALTTADGLALALCEYSDDVAAARGQARSKAAFDALIPGRTLDTRENTLLTVTQPAGDERPRALIRRTFASLAPTAR